MMRRGYVDTSLGQIHYRTQGEGAHLVLLHATPRSSRIFERIAYLLSANFQVVAFDTPGFGNSDPLPADTSIDGLATAFLEAMERLHLPRAYVLGYHTGNKIAAAMTASSPDRIARLMLVGMSHSLVINRSRREAAIHAIVDKSLHHQQDSTVEIHRRWTKTFAAVSECWLKPHIVGKPDLNELDLAVLQAEVLDIIQCRKSVDPIYRANFDFDFQAALEKIDIPTLVLELVTPEEAHLKGSGEDILKLVPRARLSVLENTGRSVWESEPERVSQIVQDFLMETV